MRLYHCPRDGQLLVRDCTRWFCLMCGFTLEQAQSEPVRPFHGWPPQANPNHERHTELSDDAEEK